MQYGLETRNIVLWIILSVVTCGIAGLVWLYYLNEDTMRLYQDDFNLSSGTVVLLALFCNIFVIYWAYKQGQRIDNRENVPNGNKSILFLLLTLFGLNVVMFALLQDDLNNLPLNPYTEV